MNLETNSNNTQLFWYSIYVLAMYAFRELRIDSILYKTYIS